jgi:hypothetical protein
MRIGLDAQVGYEEFSLRFGDLFLQLQEQLKKEEQLKTDKANTATVIEAQDHDITRTSTALDVSTTEISQ